MIAVAAAAAPSTHAGDTLRPGICPSSPEHVPAVEMRDYGPRRKTSNEFGGFISEDGSSVVHSRYIGQISNVRASEPSMSGVGSALAIGYQGYP